MPKTLKNQLVLDKYREMVHELYEEPETDITVGTFNNTEQIELQPRRNKKNDTPKRQK